VRIRLLIADDQELIASALAALLDLEADFEVVAIVGRGDEVVAAAREHRPDIALLDIEMPGIDGLAATAVLAEQVPECRALILTTFGRPGYLRRALDAGARGYLLKERPVSELAEAIRRVHAGLRAIDPALAADAWGADDDPLSDRERQILKQAGEGRSSAEIALDLRLSEGTVRNYLSDAINKLNATNRIDAARIARAHGWL